MPNTGKPSAGCHLCRTRRVKCDLTRPACQRCAKYGMDCPGYRDNLDLMFRNRGVDDVKKLAKRRQKVTSPRAQSESPLVIASSLSPSPSSVASRPSIALILDCYSVPVNGQRLFGHVDFLPVLLSEADEGSCLLYATDTLAGAYIANQTDSLPEREKASRTYGRALEAVRAALMSPTESAKDETLVSVWALAAYEILVGSAQSKRGPGPEAWHLHIDGLNTLLAFRGPGQFASKRGRNIFWTIHSHILMRSILNSVVCPPESRDLSAMFAAATMPNPDNHEMSMTFVSQFVINASDIITASMVQLRTQFVTVPECITYIYSLDATESIVPQSIYDIYSTGDTAYAWNIYRTTRMRLHHCMLMLINCALADFAIDAWEAVDDQEIQTLVRRRQEHMEILHCMAQEILSFVPATVMQAVRSKPPSPQAAESIPEPAQRSICWADALRLVWPLATIYKLPMVQEEQRLIARQSCYVIGEQWGIREALKQWSSPVARLPQAMVPGSIFDQGDCQEYSPGSSLTTKELWT